MVEETLKDIATLELPYRRKAIIRELTHESGLRMVRLILREGTRITQVDLDADAARELGTILVSAADADA